MSADTPVSAEHRPNTTTHRAYTIRRVGRYEYVPACSCGWRHEWGYVREHAAELVADAHVTKVGE